MINRLLDFLSRLRQRLNRPSTSRWLMLIATVAFAGVTYVAIRNLPSDIGPFYWPGLLVASLLVFPVALLLGLEFKEIAAISGHEMSALEGFRTSMLASASNLLPIPGAVAIKTGKLMAAGRSAKSSIGANFIVAFLWVGVALMIGGPFAMATSPPLAWVSFGGGLGCLALGTTGILRSGRDVWSTLLRVVAVEVALTIFATARVWFVTVAIGADVSLTTSVWLVVVSVLSTVVGLFPAGLGLREAISAAVAPMIGMDPAVAVLVSAVDRVVRLGVLAVLGAVVAMLSRRLSKI